MTNNNTSKEVIKSPDKALREFKDKESESLKKSKGFLIEVQANQSKSRTPNNLNNLSPHIVGPMFDEIEIERRENYQFNNYLR